MNPKDYTYTPGPWSISVDNRHIEAPGGYIIAENYNHALGYLHNLHLIASAPELYEVLKRLSNIARVINAYQHSGAEIDADQWNEMYDAEIHACMILAKAGEG